MWADGLAVLAAKSLGCSAGRGERAELSAPVQIPVPPAVTPGRAGTGGVWHGHGVFHSRDDTPTLCPGLLLLHH